MWRCREAFFLECDNVLRTSRPLLWRDVKLSRSSYEVLICAPQWWLPLRCAHGSGGSGRARGWATPWHAIPPYRRHPWDHQVGGARVFFDNGPECVDLDLGEMEMADESCTDGRCVLSCHVEPVEN